MPATFLLAVPMLLLAAMAPLAAIAAVYLRWRPGAERAGVRMLRNGRTGACAGAAAFLLLCLGTLQWWGGDVLFVSLVLGWDAGIAVAIFIAAFNREFTPD